MPTESKLLIFNCEGDIYTPEIISVNEKNIPDTLNGESGFHIYRVRTLTELILEQYNEENGGILSEEDRYAISVASSLHDIGKKRVPKEILNFPGKLSPIEYDIVKKHSDFGAEIIKEVDFGDIPPKIKDYAISIAKYHHERHDGTGYPKGLKGDDIPLAAQVVALADSYDALTSNRSYKEAFSKDVAVQMISSGMCGMFREDLVNCLLKAVNHSAFLALRDALYENRSVVSENVGFTPSRVLCVGNTEYLTASFIEETFPNCKVTVLGNSELGSAEKIKLFRIKKPSIKAIFETYDFDLVVYFSGDLTFRTTEKNDSEELREVLEAAKATGKEIKIIFFSSLDSSFKERCDRGILASAKENLCEYYSKNSKLDIKVVQIPYLYSGAYNKDFLYKAFDAATRKKRVVFDDIPETEMHFISSPDLSKLIFRIVENWKSGSGTLSIGDDFKISFGVFSEKLTELIQNAVVDFTGKVQRTEIPFNNKGIRSEYGWFAKISILEDMQEEYEKYLGRRHEKEQSRWEKFKKWISEHSLFIKISELIILFLITELFLALTDSAVIFSIIDFRMVYIVVMATVHGLNFGLYAAGLSSLSWLVAKILSGTNLLTIFYEPTNWLSFVFFFLVGALCGYVKLRKDDEIRFVQDQNKLLEDKLVFTREIYEDTYREKKDLKKQIIASKDSFGKIFDITRKLDTVEPQLLYLRTMETFEEILENKTITVYSVNKQSTFGRLEVASRDIIGNVSRSMSTESYSTVIEKLRGGQIWRNTELKQEYPMYAAGVFRGDELVLLIFLWRADIEQRSLYYVNLFKILRDLVQMSLLRAFDYNQAVYNKQYLKDTHIMNEETFKSVVENYVALAEKKVSTHVILEIESMGHSYNEIEKLLASKIRANDIVGVGPNGNLQVLLSQAAEKDLPFILPRFENFELPVKVLSK